MYPTAWRPVNQSQAAVTRLPTGCSMANCPPARLPDAITCRVKSKAPSVAAFRLPCFCELRLYVIADSVRTVLSRQKDIIAEKNRPPVAATVVYFRFDGRGRSRPYRTGRIEAAHVQPCFNPVPNTNDNSWSECSGLVGGPIRQIQFAVDLSATQDVSAGNVEDRLLCRHARAEEQQKPAELCARSIELGFRAHYRAPAD